MCQTILGNDLYLENIFKSNQNFSLMMHMRYLFKVIMYNCFKVAMIDIIMLKDFMQLFELMTYIFLNNIQGVLPFDVQFVLINNPTFDTFSLSLDLFTILLASETMNFTQLLKSSIISLTLGKCMVNIVYEVLFSSTLVHKKFSNCLTCTMAVHRYFLQFYSLVSSPASVCHFSERDKFWRERKTFRLLWNQENKNGARSFFLVSNSCCVQKEATTLL